jgi:hypothetical protein
LARHRGGSSGGQQIGLDQNGHRQGMTGPVTYWHWAGGGEGLVRREARADRVLEGMG